MLSHYKNICNVNVKRLTPLGSRGGVKFPVPKRERACLASRDIVYRNVSKRVTMIWTMFMLSPSIPGKRLLKSKRPCSRKLRMRRRARVSALLSLSV